MAAPPTPQRKSTFRSRVGGAILRSSAAFSIPGLPNRARSATPDSDIASTATSLSGKLSITSLNKFDVTAEQEDISAQQAPPSSPLSRFVKRSIRAPPNIFQSIPSLSRLHR
ncbi:hypothetical protein L210DRAFT_973122, partial [Boletus edulis BED1]